MAPLPAPSQPHIPAWKKLGLKLKYAQNDRPPTPKYSAVSTTANEKKRKYSIEVQTDKGVESPEPSAPKPSKKLKKEHSKLPSATTTLNGDKPNDTIALNSSPAPKAEPSTQSPPPSTPAITKRKSVTFTPETKSSDGQSAKDLYTNWLANQKAEDPSFAPSQAQPALHPIAPKPSILASSPEPVLQDSQLPKKSKKPKTKKPTPAPSTRTTTSEEPTGHAALALAYLTEFHESTSTWKFNSNRQKYLLKNLFDLSIIPSSYDPALKTYLRGLKGPPAKQRVRESALKIREEEMWFSDLLAKELGLAKGVGEREEKEKKRRRQEYEEAWRGEKERLEEMEEEKRLEGSKVVVKGVEMSEWEWRVRKRRRAEEVLWAVGEERTVPAAVVQAADSTQEASKNGMNGVNAGTKATANGGMGQGRQINGNTTANGKRKRVRKRRTTGVPDDESSSSSSSDSSSDEEEKANGHGNIKTPPDSKLDPDSPVRKDRRSDSATSSSGSSSESESSSGTSSSGSDGESDSTIV